MKKFLLASLLGVSVVYGFEISMNKEFVKELKPNSLSISVRISTTQKTTKDVLDKLSGYSDFIKSFKDIDIKGGNFSTYPNYKYYNHERKKIGYKGSINYQISSQDETKLKNFISMLTAKNIENDVDLSIGSGSWQVDQKSIKKEKEDLKFKAINWAENYAVNLSEKTGKKCILKSMDFSSDRYYPPVVYAEAKAARDQDNIPMPNKSMQKIEISSKIKFECK